MKRSRGLSGRATSYYVTLIFVVGVLVRIPLLFMTLNEAYGDRQTQTAFPARVWREDGFNPLSPVVPVFGNGSSELLLEFPFFQWLIYGLSYALPSLDFAARVAGLIFFQLSALGLFAFLRQITSSQFSIAVLVLYQFNGMAMKWGSTATVDLAVISFLMLGLAFFTRGLTARRFRAITLSAAWLFFAASALVKPWGIAIWLPLVLYLSFTKGRLMPGSDSKRSGVLIRLLLWPAAFGIFPLLPAWLWHEYAARQRRGHSEGARFIFGYLSDRTSVNIARILQFEYGFVIGGILVVFALLIFAGIVARTNSLDKSKVALLVVGTIVTLIPVIFFTGKFAVHNYYSILVLPAVSLVGIILVLTVLPVRSSRSFNVVSVSGVFLLLLLGIINYLIVDGGQLILKNLGDRYETGGTLATLLAVVANVCCVFILLLFLGAIAIGERSQTLSVFLGRRLFYVVFSLTLLCFVLLYWVRWNVDYPRFTNEISFDSGLFGEVEQALVLGCDATTVHYYRGARGLSLGSVEISQPQVFMITSSQPISDFDIVLACDSAQNALDTEGVSSRQLELKGISYGGEYRVSLEGFSDFERVAPYAWVKK